MIPPELLGRLRDAQDGVVTVAIRDLLAEWRRLDVSDARGATEALLPLTRDLTAAHGEVAAVAAADFYDDARSAVGPSGDFRARAAGPAPGAQADAMTRWAVTPLWAAAPDLIGARDRLAGGLSRLVQQPSRDTIVTSVARDPAGARYVRVPRPGACSFCLMLASRDDGYTSEESATQVVGRSDVSHRPLRGTRQHGDSFHSNCRCTTAPTWSPDDVPGVNRRLADEWQRVQAEADAAGELRRGTGNDSLNAWRRAVERGEVGA